jgi:hypothetical protein
MSLVEARPVLWDKTDDNYKDRNETKRDGEKFVFVFKEGFEALGDVQKKLLLSIAIIY